MHEQGLRRVRGGRAYRAGARIVRRDRATLLDLLRSRALRSGALRCDGREPQLTVVRHGPIRPASSRVLVVIGRAPVRGAGPRHRGRRLAAASRLEALAIGDRRALRRDVRGRRRRICTRRTAAATVRAGRRAGSHRGRHRRRRRGAPDPRVGFSHWRWPVSASVSPTRDRSACSSKASPRSGS